MIKAEARSQVIAWLTLGCILIFMMVLIGGITRLTGSGLSMTDWKLISGSVPPLTEEAWQESFEAYKQFPEYTIQPQGFSLSDYKKIFWWEYIHRVLGRLIGIVFILPFLYFLIRRKIQGKLIWKLVFLLGLGSLQGFFGWYMVKSGLIDNPHVSHYRLAIHLSTALLSFTYTFWLILEIIYPERIREQSATKLRNLTVVFMILLFLQIIWGAFNAGLHAGLFYNTFPKMGDRWIAEGVTALSPMYKNFVETIAGVQFIHRYLGIVLGILGIAYFFITRKSNRLIVQHAGTYVLVIVIVQVLLGIFALLYAVPLPLALVHQIGAFFLLMTMIFSLRVSAYRA